MKIFPSKRMFDAVGLALVLKGRRIFQGLAIRDAAPMIGVSIATISRVENGKEPDLQTAVKICDWLGVTMDSFVRPLPPPSPHHLLDSEHPVLPEQGRGHSEEILVDVTAHGVGRKDPPPPEAQIQILQEYPIQEPPPEDDRP